MRHSTVVCPVWSRRMFCVLAMAVIGMMVASKGPLQAQTKWTLYDGPVLDVGPAGAWDDGTVFQPCVIKDGDTLRMWYSGVDNTLNVGVSAIGYAWSLDGISWTRYPGNPVLPKSTSGWDNGNTSFGGVLREGDTLKMWYAGIPQGVLNVPGPYTSAGLATSVDGINWNRPSSPVLGPGNQGEWDGGIFFPGNVIKDDTLYKMWYSGGTGGFNSGGSIAIGYATSRDGIHWTKYNDPTTTSAPYQFSDPVLQHGTSGQADERRLWSAWVMKKGSDYQMWYIGQSPYSQTVMYATSPDGIHWTKNPTPVLVGSGWVGDIITPCVILDHDVYRMWFTGFVSGTNGLVAKIGYATAPLTSARERRSDIPLTFGLEQNYPNPFNPSTTIGYSLPHRSPVTLAVFNTLGQKVAELVNGEVGAGYHEVAFDAAHLASGVYFYRISAGDFTSVRKMMLVK